MTLKSYVTEDDRLHVARIAVKRTNRFHNIPRTYSRKYQITTPLCVEIHSFENSAQLYRFSFPFTSPSLFSVPLYIYIYVPNSYQ